MQKSPILFIIFNRPETTAKVWEAIREAHPRKLYIAADGPRPGKNEGAACEAARKVTEKIDWDCQVERKYESKNLGCKMGVSSAINWFFENETEGIILEDDCLPSQSFFKFCETMLDKYSDNEEIMMVSGTNLLSKWKDDEQDYFFSRYGGIWGWATWKRAWKYYDVEMKSWKNPSIREKIRKSLGDRQYKARAKIFNSAYNGSVDTWDFQWSFARMAQNGLSAVPAKNLVSNIGFGEKATHTKAPDSPLHDLDRFELNFPLRPNDKIGPDSKYDLRFFEKLNPKRPLLKRIIGKILSLLK